MTSEAASGKTFAQQVVLQIVAAAIAGFLGTYVGVEVVKEKIVNLGDRMEKAETRIERLENAQSTILQAQVQSLTHQLDDLPDARRRR